MRKLIGANLYAGGGIVSASLSESSGVEFVWACEYEDAIAKIHTLNFPNCEILQKRGRSLGVEEINAVEVEKPEFVWISQECKRFSKLKYLNGDNGKRDKDIREAIAVNNLLQVWQPKVIILENAPEYIGSDAQKIILFNLTNYLIREDIYECWDFGVPQLRKRSIIRLIRLDCARENIPDLPKSLVKKSWSQALANLELKPYPLADWQKQRLCSMLTNRRLLQNILNNRGLLLVQRVGAIEDKLKIALANEPSWGVRSLGHDRHWRQMDVVALPPKLDLQETSIDFLINKIISYEVSPRALARLQTVPDSYILPENKTLACRIVGNGVPSIFGKTVIQETLKYVI